MIYTLLGYGILGIAVAVMVVGEHSIGKTVFCFFAVFIGLMLVGAVGDVLNGTR